jgi:hypothetical protein
VSPLHCRASLPERRLLKSLARTSGAHAFSGYNRIPAAGTRRQPNQGTTKATLAVPLCAVSFTTSLKQRKHIRFMTGGGTTPRLPFQRCKRGHAGQ